MARKNTLADLTLKLSAETAELKRGLQEAKQNMGSFGKEAKNIMSGVGDEISDTLSRITFGASDIAVKFGKASKAAISGLKGIQKAIIATGIGAAIVGITIAVTALITAFNKNQEVADKLKTVMAGLKGVFDLVVLGLVNLGEWLIKAFSDPKEAINDLVNIIKNNLANRFKGLVQLFSSGWKVIAAGAIGVGLAVAGIFSKKARDESKKYFEDMAKELVNVSEAFLMITTGTTFNDWKKGAEGVRDAVQGSVDLERQRQAVRDQEIADLIKIKDGEAEIARIKNEAEQIVGDSSEDKLRRQELFNQALEKQIEIGNLQVGIEKRQYDLIVATNRQRSDTSESARAEEAQAYNDLQDATTQSLERQEEYKREIATLDKDLGNIQAETTANAEAQAEAVELTVDQKRALAEEEYRLQTTYEGQKEALKNLYDVGEMGLTEYQDKLKELDESYAVEGSQAALDKITQGRIDAINESLRYEELSIEQQKALYQELYDNKEISERELAKLKEDLDRSERDRRMTDMQNWISMAGSALDSISQLQQAAYNTQIAAAQGNDAKIAEIQKKFGRRQKALAIAQALINGALAVTNLIGNVPLSVLNPATWAGIGVATAATTAQVAVIASQPLAKGGIAYGETLATIGEYPGVRTNPEVVAPLSDLKNLLGGSMMNPEVKFVIEQDQLVGILSNYNNKNIYF